MPNQLNTKIKKGDHIEGYTVIRVLTLEMINAIFYELEHSATGAKHIHIANNDAENTFSVIFKTVPTDSTGVAHILEHTVLCGSEKFPVRDPFFSMIKRSLSTFMNAFTAPDWTMYPFCTQNQKDFYNLLDVYLDAAFFPKLEELSFKQEGHRLEVESAEKDNHLEYKGVVYNEMRGAMSSPDDIMERSLSEALYPMTTYGFNSGGDPAEIPKLTYEQLLNFHRRHYHPSNAFFYTYGNIPLEKHLAFIRTKILDHFDRIDPKTDVPSHPRWNAPKNASHPYPLAKNENPLKKYQVCLAWLTPDIQNTFEVMALTVLQRILLGNTASPLRKALIDSGLGSALSDSTGFHSDRRDTMFACGLKDVEAESADAIESLIINCLKDLAEKGIDKELIDGAIHRLEFQRREVTNHPYPYGLNLLLRFSGEWIHGGDPVRMLEFDEDLKRLNDEISKGAFLESRIKKYFLDNPHRVRFMLVPDHDMEQRENKRVQAELEQVKSGMKADDIERLKQEAEVLKKIQETPQNVSILPTLEIEDIPPTITCIKESSDEIITSYEQPTAGICYFLTAAGAGTLNQNLVPLAPFFCYAFTKIGTSRRNYTEIARQIESYTGGIGLSSQIQTGFQDKSFSMPYITLSAKCLVRNQEKMFNLLKEMMTEFDFSSDLRHLKNLLMEYRANLESQIIYNGTWIAMLRAARNISPTYAIRELWGGISQIRTIKEITDTLTDEKLKRIADDLAAIGKTLFTQGNIKAAIIGEANALKNGLPAAISLKNSLKYDESNGFVAPQVAIGSADIKEGWSTATAVSFVARTFKTVRLEHEDAPVLSIISRILRSMYLHREIREKGGAYGGFSVYRSHEGMFGFGSYRDPHIINTLNVFDGAAEFLRSDEYKDEDIKEAILQTCADIDKPNPPAVEAMEAFYRKLVSLTDEMRKNFKSYVLEITVKKVHEAAERHFTDMNCTGIAVISNQDMLTAANEQISGNPMEIHQI